MTEQEKKTVEKFRKLGIKKFREEKIKDEDLLSFFEYVVILNLIEKSQKENEELKADRDKFKKALAKRITYCNELEKDLFENCSNYIVSKQKIKDKIEEIQEDKTSKYYDMFLEERDLEYTIKILQELLESEE